MRFPAANIVLFASLLHVGFSHATLQIPDQIIYEGELYELKTYPLYQVFRVSPTILPESEVFTTALWRGYRAIFEVVGDQLTVVDIGIKAFDGADELGFDTFFVSVIDEVFPDQADRLMQWYTGVLAFPKVHFERYVMLRVEGGRIITKVEFSRDEYLRYRQRQLDEFRSAEHYRSTEEYRELLLEMLYEDEDEDEDEGEVDFDIDKLIFYAGEYSGRIYVDFYE